MKMFFAIGLDHGTEGKEPPLTLVESQVDADAIKALLAATYSVGIYVVEVPVWPDVRKEQK